MLPYSVREFVKCLHHAQESPHESILHNKHFEGVLF